MKPVKGKGKTSDYEFLTGYGLNTKKGTLAELRKRQKLFQHCEHDKDFDEMRLVKLNMFANLSCLQASVSCKSILMSLKECLGKRRCKNEDPNAGWEPPPANSGPSGGAFI